MYNLYLRIFLSFFSFFDQTAKENYKYNEALVFATHTRKNRYWGARTIFHVRVVLSTFIEHQSKLGRSIFFVFVLRLTFIRKTRVFIFVVYYRLSRFFVSFLFLPMHLQRLIPFSLYVLYIYFFFISDVHD